MNIINNIVQIMKEKKINQSELCLELGITDSTFSTWKIRGTDPPSKYILRICEFLDVSADTLLGRKGEQTAYSNNTIHNSNNVVLGDNAKIANGINDFEKEMLEAFRQLSFSDKAKVMNLIVELNNRK